jgi:hypothetical protein
MCPTCRRVWLDGACCMGWLVPIAHGSRCDPVDGWHAHRCSDGYQVGLGWASLCAATDHYDHDDNDDNDDNDDDNNNNHHHDHPVVVNDINVKFDDQYVVDYFDKLVINDHYDHYDNYDHNCSVSTRLR